MARSRAPGQRSAEVGVRPDHAVRHVLKIMHQRRIARNAGCSSAVSRIGLIAGLPGSMTLRPSRDQAVFPNAGFDGANGDTQTSFVSRVIGARCPVHCPATATSVAFGARMRKVTLSVSADFG